MTILKIPPVLFNIYQFKYMDVFHDPNNGDVEHINIQCILNYLLITRTLILLIILQIIGMNIMVEKIQTHVIKDKSTELNFE
jgi:hypothetical protein